jgi:Zn-dependent protease with chaperone function
MGAITLKGLRPQAYEHPTDSAALNALKHTKGFDSVIQKINAWGIERFLRVQLTGSYIKVTRDSLSDLYEILAVTRERLDVPVDVDLYISVGSEINAYTVGVERPLIVLTSAAVELLSPEELAFVIAHELGHVKSGHVLYYQIAEFLPAIAGAIGGITFGISELLSTGVQVALLHWKKMSEFTADRAGLLGCQDAEVAWRTMVKLAGLPPKYFATLNTEEFLQQARDFQAMDSDALSKIAKWVSSLGDTHPWTVVRAQQLLLWIEGGKYEETLKFPTRIPFPTTPGISRYCTKCGSALRGPEKFCPGCGLAQEAETMAARAGGS